MRNQSLCLLMFLCVALGFADSGKTLVLRKTNAKVVLDGVIDSVWSTADSVNDFVELSPYPGTTPSKKSTAKVLTTEDAIYCLMVCMDSITNIQQHTGNLDDMGGDIVSIMFDTFNDKQTAYKFAVTAAGVRADCRLLDDARTRDYNWDGVWFSAAKVYSWGFVIEMEIPYRTIQFNDRPTEWGLDFDRWIPSSNEDTYWNKYEKNEGQRISKFGKLLFKEFQPAAKGLNLEIYPVGLAKATYLPDSKYKVEPEAGVDIFYNPSQSLTFQLTANPDFAQIEADPFSFNITRYETYYNERRPFFTQGNEVFMAAGKDNNSGFYSPLQLFYSRRIGKKLYDGSEVPLNVGTKAFGRLDDWEYGGFWANTGQQDYDSNGTRYTEPQADFYSVRLKKHIMDNSTLGVLFVNKHTLGDNNGVLDIDGALRSTDWQLAYQFARSYNNEQGGYASSLGFTDFTKTWMTMMRVRYVGKQFDVSQVGYVPWIGTTNAVALTGPTWYYDAGPIRQISTWLGPFCTDERVDEFTDVGASGGFNFQFRNNWGFEIDLLAAKRKDVDTVYPGYEADYSFWWNISPKWSADFYGSFANIYNFDLGFVSYYNTVGADYSVILADLFSVGTSFNAYIEGSRERTVYDVTYNARPYISFTPLNDLNLRVYVDNTIDKSTDKLEQVIGGFLFSYSFLPKSWIYLALNEDRDRFSDEYDAVGNLLPNRMHTVSRAGVFKIKYLYYL